MRNSKNLYELIGGKATVDAGVDLFYTKVMNDPLISHFFKGVDMARQREKMKAFLKMASGGTATYDGKNMRAAHAHLVKRGLDEDHFNAVVGHLQSSLEELKVKSPLIKEVMTIVASTKNDVLGK